ITIHVVSMPLWARVLKALPRSTAPLNMTGSQPGAQLRSPSAVNSGNTRASGASSRKLRTWVAGVGADMAGLHSVSRTRVLASCLVTWYICTILTRHENGSKPCDAARLVPARPTQEARMPAKPAKQPREIERIQTGVRLEKR